MSNHNLRIHSKVSLIFFLATFSRFFYFRFKKKKTKHKNRFDLQTFVMGLDSRREHKPRAKHITQLNPLNSKEIPFSQRNRYVLRSVLFFFYSNRLDSLCPFTCLIQKTFFSPDLFSQSNKFI